MIRTEQDFVFIEANVFDKTYDNGNKRTFRFLKVANPLSFENYTIAFSEKCDATAFRKGEKVQFKIDLKEFMGKTQIEVTDILRVK